MLRRLPLAALSAVALLALFPVAVFAQADCSKNGTTAVAAFTPAGVNIVEASFTPAKKPERVCIFICEPWFSTSTHWGMGSSCTASNNDLASHVGAEASSTGPGLCNDGGAALGYCGFNLIITGSCHWDSASQMYITDGYGLIKCKDYC